MSRLSLSACLLLVCATLTQAERIEPRPPGEPAPYATCAPTTLYETQATLAWTKPSSTAGLTSVTYILERQIDAGPWTRLTAPPLSAEQVTDGPLDVGHTYTYRLSTQGKNASGGIVQSPYATWGTPNPCASIQAVPTVTLKVVGDAATPPYAVEATVSTSSGIAVKFKVDQTDYATENVAPWCLFGDDQMKCRTGKLGDGAHTVRATVLAVPGGQALATTSLALTEGAPPPEPPERVEAPLDIVAVPQCIKEGIVLTWREAPAYTDKGVMIERQEPPATTWAKLNSTKQHSYVDTATIPGEKYCYRMRYKDSQTWSNTICADAIILE